MTRGDACHGKRGALVLMAAMLALPRLALGQEAGSPWMLSETVATRQISRVRLSPGAARVLYIVREAVLNDETDRFRTRLVVANADGTGERTLLDSSFTPSAAEWSPDGQLIAVVAQGPGRADGPGLGILTLDGGLSRGDIGGTAVVDVKWAPDGRQLAVAMLSPRTMTGNSVAGVRGRVVGDGISHTVLAVVPVDSRGMPTGTPRIVSPDSLTVFTATDFGTGISWSPDSRFIAYATSPSGDWWTEWRATRIHVADAATGVARELVCCGAIAPVFAPDGQRVAYVSGSGLLPTELRVAVVDQGGGKSQLLAATPDQQPTIVGWTASGAELLVAEARRTVTRLSLLPLNGEPQRDLDDGTAVLDAAALGARGSDVAFSRQTLSSPPEVYATRLDRFAPRRVSRVNEALPRRSMPKAVILSWRSRDGAQVEGVLVYPYRYEPGRRYPLVVAVRSGGWAYQQTFLAAQSPPALKAEPYAGAAEFARRGFVVLHANIRGGTLPAYGPDAFVPMAQPALKALPDVISGVDHVIALGIADSSRVGIMGYSNGGFVTAWAITQTGRFKAAVVGAGFPDLVAAAAAQPWIGIDLGAEPWEDADRYRRQSPLLHVGAVRTPTLILHGEQDNDVPVSQGFALRSALLRVGVPVEMVVYPGVGHGRTGWSPGTLLDVARRQVEWMEKWLR